MASVNPTQSDLITVKVVGLNQEEIKFRLRKTKKVK
jgi:hypothetical protein